jgi:signal transduction histidine kinase
MLDPTSKSPTIGPTPADGRLMFTFAHDVRSHLRTILTRIQLVQRSPDATLPEADRSLLEEAEKSAVNINGLLSAMLTLLNPENDTSEMDLRLLLEGSFIEMKPTLAVAKAELEVRNDLKVLVPVRLGRVVKELLANACKFRDLDRPLKICVVTKVTPEGILELAVSDNGLGVCPPYLEQIFLPFRRLHSPQQFPGHGLGLAICRRITAQCGGAILAEAGREGLTVHVSIPLA